MMRWNLRSSALSAVSPCGGFDELAYLLPPSGEIEIEILIVEAEPGKIDPEIKPTAEDLSELGEPEMGRDRECHTSSCLYGQSPIVVRASRPQGDDSDYH